MRVVCISDTHSLHHRLTLPDGDVPVHAGDLSERGREPEIRAFDAWLGAQPHRHEVMIAGNHDLAFEARPDTATWIRNAQCLQDRGVPIEGVWFRGSPWQPRCFDWAFHLVRGAPLQARWNLIPAGTEVLVTHGPPFGRHDRTYDGPTTFVNASACTLEYAPTQAPVVADP